MQSITTTKLRDRTCVICNFAQGSTASGCHIRFMDAMHGDKEVKAIDAIRIPQDSLTSSNCTDGLPSGVFRVLASDISSTGVEDYRVAVVGSSLITVLEITTLMPTSQQHSSKQLLDYSKINCCSLPNVFILCVYHYRVILICAYLTSHSKIYRPRQFEINRPIACSDTYCRYHRDKHPESLTCLISCWLSNAI